MKPDAHVPARPERQPPCQPDLLDEVYRTFRTRLCAQARHHLAGTGAQDAADDLVHEAFARALDQQFEDADHARRWLWVTVSRLAIDQRRARHRLASLDASTAGVAEAAVEHDHADTTLQRLAIATTLGSLPDRRRQMLWERDALGASIGEIAVRHGLTEGSTRVVLTRIRRQAADLLSTALSVTAAMSVTRRLFRWLDSHTPQSTAAAVGAVMAAALITGSLPAAPPHDPGGPPTTAAVQARVDHTAVPGPNPVPEEQVTTTRAHQVAAAHGPGTREASAGEVPTRLNLPTPLGEVRWHHEPPDQPPTGAMVDIHAPVIGDNRTGATLYSDRDPVPQQCTHITITPADGTVDTDQCEPAPLDERHA